MDAAPFFRAAHVGSLIRPRALRLARQAYLDGKLPATCRSASSNCAWWA